MAQIQKQKDPEFWLMHKRNGQASSASLATIRGQTVSSGSSLVHNVGHSLGPGGRRLRTVDAGDRGLFEEDDEEGVDGELKRRRDRERGQEGDLDEMEYEEDFADDDDKMEPEGINDEETKEIEVCAVSLQRRRRRTAGYRCHSSFNHLSFRNDLNVNIGTQIKLARAILMSLRRKTKASTLPVPVRP